jgi:hypothetical protein
MRRLAVAALLVVSGAACSGPSQRGTVGNVNETCQVVLQADQVARCVGKTVTLRGLVTRTKIPTILGVDVDADYALSDQVAEATGLLVTYSVEAPRPGEPIVQSRGPGTYYRLTTADGVGLVRAKLVK